MAKKKNTVVINQEELSKTVLGDIDEKKGNITFLIVIFVLLIAAVFFSPYVTQYISKIKDGDSSNTPVINPDKTDDNVDKDENKTYEIVDYKDDMSLTLDDLIINNLVISSNNLSYKVTVLEGKNLDLSLHNYFIEFYNNDTLITRRKLESLKLNSKVVKEYSYSFDYQNINKVSLVEKTIDEYPNVTIDADENNNQAMICKNDVETITYTFSKDKLYRISDEIKININLDTYDSLYENYANIAEKYNNYKGYSSNISVLNDNVIFTFVLDLNFADISLSSSNYYYKKDTSPSVVKFELEAQGFKCS